MRIAGLAVAGILAAAMVAAGSVESAEAGPINGREHRQVRKIVHGIRSGALTRREAARLIAEQAHVRLMERRFRRSGHGLSTWEYARLQRALNRSSRHIYRHMHDRKLR